MCKPVVENWPQNIVLNNLLYNFVIVFCFFCFSLMYKLPSTDKSSRAPRQLCTSSSWWITSSTTSWEGRALLLRTAWATPLTATARGAAASPLAGSTWCRSWTLWGPCTSIQSRSKEATVTLVPWSRGSGPLVTLTNCKPNHALFTAFSSARGRWNYNANGRKLPPPLPVKFHRLRALSTSREKKDSDYCWTLGKSISNKTGISQKLFYKRSLIIDCRTWHNVLETQIWYFVSFICCLFTARLGASFSLSLSPSPALRDIGINSGQE